MCLPPDVVGLIGLVVVMVLRVLRESPIVSSGGLVMLGVRVTGVPRRSSIANGHWSLAGEVMLSVGELSACVSQKSLP